MTQWNADALPASHSAPPPDKERFQTAGLDQHLYNYNMETCAVYKDDAVIYSYEAENGLSLKQHKINSVTKSILSLTLAQAIEKGYVASLDQSVADYFPDWPKTDAAKEVSIKDLLQMTSGTGRLKWQEIVKSRNWTEEILRILVSDSSSTNMQYNNADSHLLSALISSATGMTASAFAEESIFAPLAISNFRWEEAPEKVSVGGYGLHMTPSDLLKLAAELLMPDSEIISARWLKQAVTDTVPTDRWKQHYGYHWWVSEKILGRQPRFYYAAGSGGKFIFIEPDQKLAAVFTGDLSGKDSLLPYQWFVRYIAGE